MADNLPRVLEGPAVDGYAVMPVRINVAARASSGAQAARQVGRQTSGPARGRAAEATVPRA